MRTDTEVDRQARDDVRKLKRVARTERPTLPVLIEYILWTLALASVLGMMLIMPWVGSDKLIPGQVWLGYSLIGILLFGGLAVGVRLLFNQIGDDIDQPVRRREQTGGR